MGRRYTPFCDEVPPPRPRADLFLDLVEIRSEVAEDDLVERFLAKQIAAEDRLGGTTRRRRRLRDRRVPRARVVTLTPWTIAREPEVGNSQSDVKEATQNRVFVPRKALASTTIAAVRSPTSRAGRREVKTEMPNRRNDARMAQ